MPGVLSPPRCSAVPASSTVQLFELLEFQLATYIIVATTTLSCFFSRGKMMCFSKIFAVICISAISVIVPLSERCLATAAVVASESSDGGCHCKTELSLTIPPCLCSDTLEALKEVNRLKAYIQNLQKECITVNTNLSYACK